MHHTDPNWLHSGNILPVTNNASIIRRFYETTPSLLLIREYATFSTNAVFREYIMWEIKDLSCWSVPSASKSKSLLSGRTGQIKAKTVR